jgi:arylformamidase
MSAPAMIDITGPVESGMWSYAEPYFPPQISAIASPAWSAREIHQQAIAMPLQTGTYLETAAHVFPDRELVAEVALERTVLLPSVCVQVPAEAGQPIEAEGLRQALDRLDPAPSLRGTGLLVGTRWGQRWQAPEFVTDGPFFAPDAIDLVVSAGVGLLGADLPRFDDPRNPTGHLTRFFETDALLLAPLQGLERIGDARGRIIAAPLRIGGVCASPVRAVWVGDEL